LSQGSPDINIVYRTFQQAHMTEANALEVFYNTAQQLNEENVKLRARIMELEKLHKVEEPKKK